MRTVAYRNFLRAAAADIEVLGAAGVATVHEAQRRTGLMKPYLRPIQSSVAIAGSAVTVLMHPGDNWMIHVAVEMVQPGDVPVVALVSDCTDGLFGDLLVTSLKARGARGLVIDGGVRDVATLNAMGFPVWPRAVSAQGAVKETVGAVNVPVVCAGAHVRPGDVIVADDDDDDDGVVVVPRPLAAETARRAAEREAMEAGKRATLASGVLGLDMYKMREALAAKGLTYSDEAVDWYSGFDEA
ncbi:4-carboxy-4-hydroxy-2-oxoadipate aldolase/oxaloacetate decarboxylase [Cupriavidus basilensis]|uniref:4-carboxy-4-hydroxy-2-oxoadipate aldolase/oxaloacetate decarboxylase n=1 Tax=Cupriavidus basilensis TaxID=68895 RepID=UPI00157BB548|nr:4-carboxy-4-hydroxy-2-oxoadipate aldolase/oxaloacetate decarboxylase [Cupriavidus basilensis]NUA31263.1 4-carboxy-4-hydroxy-2-oxoadipate aldolase/oxaloacetate decarboxylase [Cupriavidus basilensis]